MLPPGWLWALARLTFSSNPFRFGPSAWYNDRMRLRCVLFKYSTGGERVRWFHDDGSLWAQQVLEMRLPSGELRYTGGDPTEVFYMPAIPDLIEVGKAVELA